MVMWAELDIREKREGIGILKRRTDTTMGAAEWWMKNRIEAREGAMEALYFRSRERLGKRISDHVGTLAVDEAKELVMDDLFTKPVIACVSSRCAHQHTADVSRDDAAAGAAAVPRTWAIIRETSCSQ
jgi:hypothetical protein